MKQLELHLHDKPIGKVKIDSVRGHETWMFAFHPDYLNPANPMLDPSIANVRGPQFPRNMVGRIEYETSVLARKVGLDVPETKCQKLSKSGTTFFSKRFDRKDGRRIHYASAMTMLCAMDGEGDHGYLEIAEWLAQNGAEPETDLHELWRRMVFSYFIKNTDDHLRNHGFLLTEKGWRLAPMFDVNPNPDGGEHALDIGDPIKDAACYRLTHAEAQAHYNEIRAAVVA